MSDVTRLEKVIGGVKPRPTDEMLRQVYAELRRLATRKLAHKKPGQTIQPTALVHEAYLRLSRANTSQLWESRGHFFTAAAEAMRRILIERARHKRTIKAGGGGHRVALMPIESNTRSPEVLELSEALDDLARQCPRQAELVKLRYFAGLTSRQAAEVIGISPSTADNDWAYAKTWLRLALSKDSD